MGGGSPLKEALEAVAALEVSRLREHAAPGMRVFAPFDEVAPPGRPGGDAIEAAFVRVGAWAGGPLRLTARVVDGVWALGEYARAADEAPLTAVVRLDGHGLLDELRVYLDVGPGGAS